MPTPVITWLLINVILMGAFSSSTTTTITTTNRHDSLNHGVVGGSGKLADAAANAAHAPGPFSSIDTSTATTTTTTSTGDHGSLGGGVGGGSGKPAAAAANAAHATGAFSSIGASTTTITSTGTHGLPNGGVGGSGKPAAAAANAAQATALFVFGDSLVDNGNNNFLNSIAKSNYYPYGIDIKGGATGRFSNGYTFIDYLGAWLGLAAPPPFADPATTGARILGGVNYASAAAGILDETGQHYGQRYTLSQQVLNFETTLSQLRTMMGGPNLNKYLSKSIAVLVFGSNDYINNYLMPGMYPSSFNYNPTEFAKLLLNHYARQLVTLYSLGLRKFILPGIGPLGCIPNQLATGQALPGRCVDYVNQMLGAFNQGLLSLVNVMNNGTHPGSMFVYGNTYGAIGDVLNNPGRYGFKVVNRGCCGIGLNQGQITCMPWVSPCPNRNEYVFWDAFHPTQIVNAILAQRAYAGPPSDAYPINAQQLALINFSV